MLESHLAPLTAATVARDLSSVELWEISLQRSRRRRELAARHRKAAPKTKSTAAAMSAALLVSPILPLAPASAGTLDGERRSASEIGGVIASRGDVGGPVAALQRTVGVDDDGIFGPVTERAVADFQARAGLPRTGDVDAQTWKALLRAAGTVARSQSAGSGRIVAQQKRRPRLTVAKPRRGGGGNSGGALALAEDGARAPAPDRHCGGPIATPIQGTVTSGFGDRRHHAGIDLSAPVGTPVGAAACGTVTLAATQSGYGRIVCIQHSATFSTCYAHLSQIPVRSGASVEVGQIVGMVGVSGRSSGPHLHFETRVNGRAQDPAPYLSGTQTIASTARSRAAATSTGAQRSPVVKQRA